MVDPNLTALIRELTKFLSAAAWLLPLLSLVALAFGVFAGAYLRRRGEDKAIREGFDSLREQLKTTTRDTEAIKQALSGQAWRSQQQWAARQEYYSALLTHLHHFRNALSDLDVYYLAPGSEHTPDSEQGERFHRLMEEASASFEEVRKLLGPAAIFLSAQALDSLDELFRDHFDLSNFEAICTADYVGRAHRMAQVAYAQVLSEAKAQLGTGS